MIDDNIKKDSLFETLFQHSPIEKAPDGLVDKIMMAVEVEPLPERQSRWSFGGLWMWSSIGLGFASLIVTVFFIDFSFMGNIFNGIEVDGSMVSNFISQLNVGFTGIFENFTASSVSIMIFLALLALFVLDRILRRKTRIEFHLI